MSIFRNFIWYYLTFTPELPKQRGGLKRAHRDYIYTEHSTVKYYFPYSLMWTLWTLWKCFITILYFIKIFQESCISRDIMNILPKNILRRMFRFRDWKLVMGKLCLDTRYGMWLFSPHKPPADALVAQLRFLCLEHETWHLEIKGTWKVSACIKS